MEPLALRFHDVHYRYPDRTPGLAGCTLEVPVGENWALIGPNGAGKTTLMTLADGLIRPERGEIEVFGTSLTANGRVDHARKQVGIVFQNADDQVFCPTVFEDVVFGPLNLDLSPGEAHDRAHEALNKVGLNGFENRVPQHLSGGEKRKVALATVLAMNPGLILFDEPTTGLDPKGREELLIMLAGSKETLLIATHDFEVAIRVCDRVALMCRGRIVKVGTPKQILFDKELLEANDLAQPSWLPYLADRAGA